VEPKPDSYGTRWRTAHGDLTDEEWERIADLVPTYSGDGRMGRPAVHDKRDVVNAIFYVAATGCQWRALPACYPHWNTVHRYHLRWSRDGTWERICDRLRSLVREAEGRDAEASAGVIDARSVRGASTVTSSTRGYDAGKKVSGRKTFGVVDTLGLLVAVVVVVASTSDNVGGIAAVDRARPKSKRLSKIFCDAGFKRAFASHCGAHHISAEVVKKIHSGTFEVLPRRWVVERTWSWLMNNRRLQVDYERLPVVAEGFVWAAHARLLLRRLTAQATTIHRAA
jgi:transposase